MVINKKHFQVNYFFDNVLLVFRTKNIGDRTRTGYGPRRLELPYLLENKPISLFASKYGTLKVKIKIESGFKHKLLV